MVSFGSQGHHDYPARDPTAVAPGWLSPVLAVEIPLLWRPAADRRGTARVDPADERGKSAVGERRASMASCSSSASKSLSPASRSTWSSDAARPLRAGTLSCV